MGNKKILVSAGDPSGDRLLAQVVNHVKEMGHSVEFLGLCGPSSENAGVQPLVQSNQVAVVGLVEVFRAIPKIFSALGKLSGELKNVDSVLCVDFPDFNFRLAHLARRKSRPVDYLVAPQVWAWRSQRMEDMRSFVRQLYPALPFEQEIFQKQGVNTKFLGHPLRDTLASRDRKGAREDLKIKAGEKVLLCMPGSRTGEIKRHFPLMISAWKQFVEFNSQLGVKKFSKVIVSVAPGREEEELFFSLSKKDQKVLKDWVDRGIWSFSKDNHRSMMAADFAWITSGTATLEAAFYQLPHILLYRLNTFSAAVLKALSPYFLEREAYAGLPNILLERSVIPELLQDDLSSKRLAYESSQLLADPIRMKWIRKQLRWIPKKLGKPGASKRIAEDLLRLWKVEPQFQCPSRPQPN